LKLGDSARTCLVLLTLGVSLAVGQEPPADDDRVLRVGVNRDYAPYEFLDEDGRPTGYCISLIRAVAEVKGLEIELVPGPWSEIRARLESGEIDAVPGMLVSRERDKRVDFTSAHLTVDYSIFVRTGTKGILTEDSLRGLSILVERGSLMHDRMTALGFAADLHPVESEPEALRVLSRGRHDCALLPYRSGLLTARTDGLEGVEPVGPPIYRASLAFAVTEGNAALVQELEEGLEAVRATGLYQEIYHEWFGAISAGGPVWAELALWLVPVAAVVLLLIGVLLLWSWSMQRQVALRTRELKREIEERREAELALRDSEDRFRRIVEDQTEFIVRWRPDGTRTYVNRSYARYFGRPREELIGTSFFPVIAEEDREAVRNRIAALTPEAPISTDEHRVIRPDGSTGWQQWTDRAFFDAEGKVVELQSVGHDITDRKLAESRVRTSETVFHSIFENVQDMISVLDAEGRALFQSRSIERTLGWSEEERRGKSAFELLHPDEVSATQEVYAQAMARPGSRTTLVHRFRHKEGGWRTLESVGSAYRTAKGELRMVINARDITDLRKAEREQRSLETQLQQAQKMEAIALLAGGVAHDFNNLLTVIGGYADVLARKPDTERLERGLNEIKTAHDRAVGLTRQLLAFGRRQLLQPRVLPLSESVRRVHALLGRLLGVNYELDVEMEDGTGNVWADPGQVEQVVMNLVLNARDAMPDGGTISVRTENRELEDAETVCGTVIEPGPWVVLTVRDSGCGMAPDLIPHIFEPFFTTKSNERGTGLGLSTVFGIVRQSEGQVTVESAHGEGSTFRVFLPRIDAAAQSVVGADDDVADLRGTETILVADDDDSIRDLVSTILEEQGYRVVEARDGVEALRLADEHGGKIDLLVSDFLMPGMNGRELADRFREEHPRTAVMHMSGFVDSSIGSLGPSEPFLAKPFSPSELIRLVRELLDA
jgi:PAS domain S-box-containing protein